MPDPEAIGYRSGVLDDRYELQRVIGRGGTADVYQAIDQTLGREVAVKMLRAHSASETDRVRFISEARTLAALDHPRLMTVLDAGADGDQLYLVLSLIDGRSLSELRGEAMPLSRVAAVGAQIADALAYAHDQGVIHRDVKPGNVLVGEEGHAWLGDFGISRVVGEAVRHTETGKLIGTAAYLAPEQVRGTELTPAADIYSLGLVLLELVTGEVSYPGPPVEAALARLSNGPDIPADLPLDWQRLLRRMTALEPGDRFAAAECATALHSLAEGREPAMSPLVAVPVPATVPAPAAAPAPPTVRAPATVPAPVADGGPPTELMASPFAAGPARRRWLLGAVGTVVAALISVGVVLNGGEAEPDPAPDPIPAGLAPGLRAPLSGLHDALTPEVMKALPSLAATLERLDGAIANERFKRARGQLAELEETVEFGLENQVVDETAAERVLAAAAALEDALPAPRTASPTTTPTPPGSTTGAGQGGSGDQADQGDRGKGAGKKGPGKNSPGKGRGNKR